MPCDILKAIARQTGSFLLLGSLLAGCFPASPTSVSKVPLVDSAATTVQVSVETQATSLVAAALCSGAFVAHDLDHITRAGEATPRLFDSNGSGLAVNDLDGDGDP